MSLPKRPSVGSHDLIEKLQMGIKQEIKSYLFCSILESAAVQSEMKVVILCENDVQVRHFRHTCQFFRIIQESPGYSADPPLSVRVTKSAG